MLLITEIIDEYELDVVCEQKEDKKKTFKIKGPFLQSEIKNRNGRIYNKQLIEREVGVFTKEKINNKRALGEMDHPPTPTINLQNVSHIIENLQMDNNNAIGIAKILDTPKGKIAQTFLESGVKLGVSSRGVGSLNGNHVDDSYHLITVDLVCDPSGPDAFVKGIVENKEWIMDGNTFVEKAVEKLEEDLSKHGSREILRDIQTFLKNIEW